MAASENLRSSIKYDGLGSILLEYEYTGKRSNFNPSKIGVHFGYGVAAQKATLGRVPIALQEATISGSKITYKVDLASIPLSITNEQLKAADSFYFNVDTSKRIDESNEVDNLSFLQLPFVRKIPKIMTNQGKEWDVAADIQAKWFNGKSNPWIHRDPSAPRFSEDIKLKSNRDAKVVTVDLAWIFDKKVDTNGRARAVFGGFLKPGGIFTKKSIEILDRKINEAAKPALIKGDDSFSFYPHVPERGTNLDLVSPKNTTYSISQIQRVLDTHFQIGKDGGVTSGTTVDPLTGALGDFNFYVTAWVYGERFNVPKGHANFGKYKLDIALNVTALDLFEFNARRFSIFSPGTYIEQPLGYWDPVVGPNKSMKGTYVDNKSYRDYRDLTGMGEDLIIASQPNFLMPEGKEPTGIYDPKSGSIAWSNLNQSWKPTGALWGQTF